MRVLFAGSSSTSPLFTERIAPGAFDNVMGNDVRGLFNHDINMVLGRTKAETMRIEQDHIGLRYEIDLPNTQVANDLRVSIQRGDISGSSFSFDTARVSWIDRPEERMSIRVIEEIAALYDAGPVTFPAYESTSVEARSEFREEMEAWKRSQGESDDEPASEDAEGEEPKTPAESGEETPEPEEKPEGDDTPPERNDANLVDIDLEIMQKTLAMDDEE